LILLSCLFQKLKRSFSITLIVLFLLNFVGVYLYFGIRLFQIRTEMRAALRDLPKEKLETFSMSQEEFEKVLVDEHEIKMKGRMYDIARIERDHQRIIVYALHDEAEDNLLSFLDEIAKRPLRDKKSPPSQILRFIALTFLPPSKASLSDRDGKILKLNTKYTFNHSNIARSIESPPPQA
jgi:hypothetical protein